MRHDSLSTLITLNMRTLSCHAQCILIVEISPLRSHDLASRQYHKTSIKTARTKIWIIVRSNVPNRSPSPISSKVGHTGIPTLSSPYLNRSLASIATNRPSCHHHWTWGPSSPESFICEAAPLPEKCWIGEQVDLKDVWGISMRRARHCRDQISQSIESVSRRLKERSWAVRGPVWKGWTKCGCRG